MLTEPRPAPAATQSQPPPATRPGASAAVVPDDSVPGDTAHWRDKLLSEITLGALVVACVGSAVGIGFAAFGALWHIVAFDAGIVAWMALLQGLRRRLSYRQRVWGILAMALVVGVFFFIVTPVLGLVYLSLLPLLSALFLGLTATVFCLALATVFVLGMSWANHIDWMVAGLTGNLWAQRLLVGSNFFVMNALIALSITVLMRNLSRAAQRALQARAGLQQLAMFDSLTGLPNRHLLRDRLNGSLGHAQRSGGHGAVMFIDLDHFKKVNDTHGHAVGDQFLQMAAVRLKSQLFRHTDTLARVGGDEFVALLSDLAAGPEDAAHAALQAADRLRRAMEAPFDIQGRSYEFSISIGLTLFPGQAKTVDALLDEADTAMYHAKDSGRNRIEFFESSMQNALQQKLALENDLAQALARDELSLVVQPQMTPRGVPSGAELLLRWKHPTRGNVPPDQFIPLAEQTGQIQAIGDWVLQQACALVAQLRQRGLQFPLSINISPYQFHQPGYVERVATLLASSQARGDDLVFEVTEGLLIKDVQHTVARMREMVAMGIRFSVDDFGTGYSSLNYLKRLPLHELKIDRCFVRDLPDDANDAAIVRMILSMAAELKLQVVAEGVETAQQAKFLEDLGCRRLQGYYCARPQPVQDWLDSLTPTTAAVDQRQAAESSP